MFTGLIKEIGRIKSITPNKEGKLLTISSRELICEIGIDDSVSVNGACQTVISYNSSDFTVQAVSTTLTKTTLGLLKIGEEVNLELALRLSDRLGGHLVQGHVNQIGHVVKINSIGDNYVLSIKADHNLMKYIVKEGSVTLNGISLTVSEILESNNSFSVSVIPHTWFNTTFKNIKIGDKLNIEVDIIAKYVENLLIKSEKDVNIKRESKITESWLREQGY